MCASVRGSFEPAGDEVKKFVASHAVDKTKNQMQNPPHYKQKKKKKQGFLSQMMAGGGGMAPPAI